MILKTFVGIPANVFLFFNAKAVNFDKKIVENAIIY